MDHWGEDRGRGAVGGKQTEREKWMRQIIMRGDIGEMKENRVGEKMSEGHCQENRLRGKWEGRKLKGEMGE